MSSVGSMPMFTFGSTVGCTMVCCPLGTTAGRSSGISAKPVLGSRASGCRSYGRYGIFTVMFECSDTGQKDWWYSTSRPSTMVRTPRPLPAAPRMPRSSSQPRKPLRSTMAALLTTTSMRIGPKDSFFHWK